jgi:hypothetical protein
MSINTTDLVNLGEIAAQAWDECDVALEQLNEGFGRPYEAAKDNLLRDVKLAEQEGLKFKQYNTNIVIRVHRKPTAHTKLEKLAAKIASLESELKLAKLKLKHEAEQLVLSGQCDNVTEKVVLAFSRIK